MYGFLVDTSLARSNPAKPENDFASDNALSEAKSFSGLAGLDLAKEVSTKKPYIFTATSDSTNEQYHVVAIDFGVKTNILNLLSKNGCKVTVLPAQSSFDEVMKLHYLIK